MPIVGVTSRATTTPGRAGDGRGIAADRRRWLRPGRRTCPSRCRRRPHRRRRPALRRRRPPATVAAPIDYASRADDLMAHQVPRLAQRAERLVARVLFTASRSANVPGDETIRAAASAVGHDSGDTPRRPAGLGARGAAARRGGAIRIRAPRRHAGSAGAAGARVRRQSARRRSGRQPRLPASAPAPGAGRGRAPARAARPDAARRAPARKPDRGLGDARDRERALRARARFPQRLPGRPGAGIEPRAPVQGRARRLRALRRTAARSGRGDAAEREHLRSQRRRAVLRMAGAAPGERIGALNGERPAR